MVRRTPAGEGGTVAIRGPETRGDPRRIPLGTALSMAGPAVVGLLLFVAVPFFLAVGLSFTDARLGSPLPIHFVGLEQYGRVFASPAFRHALVNNALFAVVVVPVQTALALAAAMLLHRGLRGSTLFRAAFFLPVVFPMALVSVVWEMLYAPGPHGALNAVLAAVTFGAWVPRDFLHDPTLALPSLMALSIWQGMGFQMVILLAGLQAIPERLYEAAALDGAGAWGRFRHVTLPGLRNPLTFVVVITTVLAFRVFDQVRILTRGGPGERTTTVMYEAVRAAFDRQQIGRSAAMTVVFFVLVLAVTAVGMLLGRRRPARGMRANVRRAAADSSGGAR